MGEVIKGGPARLPTAVAQAERSQVREPGPHHEVAGCLFAEVLRGCRPQSALLEEVDSGVSMSEPHRELAGGVELPRDREWLKDPLLTGRVGHGLNEGERPTPIDVAAGGEQGQGILCRGEGALHGDARVHQRPVALQDGASVGLDLDQEVGADQEDGGSG